jgi:hypothetical protein
MPQIERDQRKICPSSTRNDSIIRMEIHAYILRYSMLVNKSRRSNSRRRGFARNVEILLIYCQVVASVPTKACSINQFPLKFRQYLKYIYHKTYLVINAFRAVKHNTLLRQGFGQILNVNESGLG